MEETREIHKRQRQDENDNYDMSQIEKFPKTDFNSTTNSLVSPLLTDLYQITMTYAHWKSGRTEEHSVFDLFFRKNPFHGEFCIFAGVDEILRFLVSYRFSNSDINYLKSIMSTCDPAFFDWLKTVDCSKIKVYGIPEGSFVFPKEPLLRLEGPLAILQLLETTLLNLINFPSLITTNALRMKLVAGPTKKLLEFGLRRAQGPDGGLSASKYAYLGGFHGTSNVLAGKLFDMNVSGTHAHAYVMAHTDLSDISTPMLTSTSGNTVNFLDLVLSKRQLFQYETTNNGELAAFIEYAQAFPHNFLALVDTYDTLSSGVPNFICVAVVLAELGYEPKGVRLDSGDLGYLSRETRNMFKKVDKILGNTVLTHMNIVASNDINENVIHSLNREGHEIDTFGIGTQLVTCYIQPALGCVYKLVEIKNQPRIKLSQEVEKMVIPGRKSIYRLYGKDGKSILDLIQLVDESPPIVGQSVMCRHPFEENKRAYVIPTKVESLLHLIFEHGSIVGTPSSLEESRTRCQQQIQTIRSDHIRETNPTPYKVAVSQRLYEYLRQLWFKEAPVAELM